MKDELLMRFIDGTATEKEVEAVMEMLSKDDAAAKEWMQMAHAARLADTPPAVTISEQEAEKFVQETLHKTEVAAATPSGKVRRMPWIFGGAVAAAAVALVVSLSFGGGQSGTGSGMNENLHAGLVPEDTVEVVVPEDVAVPEDSAGEAPVVSPKTMEVKEYVAHADAQPKTDTQEGVVSQKTLTEDISTAGRGAVEFTENLLEEAVEPVFNVVKPAKTPYRVRVTNVDKDFVFEWEASGAKGISLVITDSKGVTLMDKMLSPEEGKCPVKAAQLANLGELTWILTASFEDETVLVRTGKIEFVIK